LPLGFDWKIAIALISGFVAREVIIGSLATLYAVEHIGNSSVSVLSRVLVNEWSFATGLSLLIWYVFSCQCFSTLAVTYKETQSWKWPALMLGYMTALAYGGSWVTYHLCTYLGF
jgi:ferrous iron transport protein B